ncbi:Transcriptional regulatory protein LiaR [Microbacterium trichothecenolyticum]|uniref:Transcriptional regulatory protein LiaR n=2 Tax=Microbacterium trichothecenolyticum TaxID=69370 RepID=A0A0M2HCE0_MICTR|nr:Transcriptional regulatory protein LiaR [Microbacterium trichothecenolyticum]
MIGGMQIGRVPLVGRQADLDALREEVDAVGAEGRAVVVSGDAGMGKTRLLRDFTESLDGAVVVRGACVDSGSGPAPLTAITDLLRDLVDALGVEAVREAAGPGADALGVLVPALADSAGDAERLADVVVELFSQLARTHRLVVIIEDLHWADSTTCDIAARLVRRAAALPLFVLLSYRTDDVGRAHPLRPVLAELDRARLLTHRPLARLSPAEVGALATAVHGDALAPGVLNDIAARSEGIPFYVEELASFSGARLPVSLRDVLLLRYERLDAEARRFARVLATGGVEVAHPVLRDVFADDEAALEEAVRSAVDAQVVVIREDAYAFRHALMQEAVYAELLPTERTRLHTAYAVALENSAPTARVLADIAHHWRAARVPDRALAAGVAAQRAASVASAWSTAAEAGERVLELWDAVPEPEEVCGMPRAEVLRRTSAALVSANRNDRALAFAQEAVALWPADDVVGRAEMLGDLATIEFQAGVSDGIESIEQALAILGDDPRHGVQRAGLLLSSARVHMLNGRQVLGDEVAAQARATAQMAESAGDPAAAEIVAQALLISATCRASIGDVRGVALFDEARGYSTGFVRAMMRYYINYSNTLMQVGRYDDAVAVAQEGLEYGRSHVADVGPLVMIEANVIEAHIYAGRLREAEELGGLLPLVEPGLYSAFLRERLVCLAIWRGRIDGAETALEAARLELDRFGAYEYQTRFGMAYDLGELALARGDAHEALAHARLAWETPAGGVLALPLTAIAARAAVMLRERGDDTDIEPYREVLATFEDWPVTPLWAAVFAAELGEGPWAAAIDAAGPAYIRAYARLRHGETLLAAGERTAAKEALAAATAYAEELGADGLAARAHDVMTDAGLGEVAPRSLLTAREEQVLELVAEGLSNGQIAQRLYISVKTVSVHVSAILRKLDAPSRTAAAAIYRRSAA